MRVSVPPRSRRAVVVTAVAVISLVLGGIAVAQAPFTDIQGNFHEDNIRTAYELGITLGTTPTTYTPGANVRRDQMASFLIRSLEHAHPQIEVQWLVELVDEAFVLPDGTTFTQDNESQAMRAFQEEEPPPVGAQFMLTETIRSVDAAGQPGAVIGATHITCLAQVEPGRFTCDGVFEIDGEGSLYGTVSVNFFEGDPDAPLEIAVTGGTGAFHGATGQLSIVGQGELELVSGTVLLHGTR